MLIICSINFHSKIIMDHSFCGHKMHDINNVRLNEEKNNVRVNKQKKNVRLNKQTEMGRKRKLPLSYSVRPWYRGDISSDSDEELQIPPSSIQSRTEFSHVSREQIPSDVPSQPLSSESIISGMILMI